MVQLVRFLSCFVALSLLQVRVEAAGKVLDINDKLPELIAKHPDKNWLIKFYAPWCYHCQQLEPTYNNVAEKVYSHHDTVIVGRVDCTKSSKVCEKYLVDSYPTIIHISGDRNVKYRGDRSEAALLSFTDRLEGPDVNTVRSCEQLKERIEKHGRIILSNIVDSNNELLSAFKSLAREHKFYHWFYQHNAPCPSISRPGLYLLKKHLHVPAQFNDTGIEKNDIKEAILQWISDESFPVYGQITQRNFEHYLKSDRLLVIAVLYEYRPARRFSAQSHRFHKQFEELAKKNAHQQKDMIFAWSSDLELIEYVTISTINTPNVLLLKPDLTYHLLNDKQPAKADDNDIAIQRVSSLLTAAHDGKLLFVGGDKYLYAIMRFLIGNLSKFLTMYRANPLLVSLIFGFPSVIIIFVIYTTCFYEGRQDDELNDELLDQYADDNDQEAVSEDEEADVDARRSAQSNGHLKQD